jgi:hypothetical protein
VDALFEALNGGDLELTLEAMKLRQPGKRKFRFQDKYLALARICADPVLKFHNLSQVTRTIFLEKCGMNDSCGCRMCT